MLLRRLICELAAAYLPASDPCRGVDVGCQHEREGRIWCALARGDGNFCREDERGARFYKVTDAAIRQGDPQASVAGDPRVLEVRCYTSNRSRLGTNAEIYADG